MPKKQHTDYRLNIRLSQDEREKIERFAAKTTCRSISDYARKVLLKEPVTIFYRNQSFDQFEQTMIDILRELETLGRELRVDGYLEKIDQLRFITEKIAEACAPR